MFDRDGGATDRVRMPRGRHFAVTWSIPDDYGGMTAALLARSSAFARLGGVEVQVLTFDACADTPSLEARLRDRGAIATGVRIVNLVEWLRSNPLPGGSLRLDRETFTPLAEGEADEMLRRDDGRVIARVRRDDGGRLLQIDHLRDDGSLVLSDRRDTRRRGEPGGRSLVLCDASGAPVRSWRRAWPMYTAWLDALTASEPSCMIVDSKTIAPFMLGYRRSHVITAHVVHASHRAGRGAEHPVRASRREVFAHLDDFDLVALLSQRQAAEVAELVGPHEHLTVIPNARPPRDADAETRRRRRGSPPRPVGAGVVLASLTPRKRVSDAIAAVAAAQRDAAAPLTLDVYGDGEEREALARRASEAPGVQLHGFAPDARRQLATRSFLVLTSRSEGFPLVLVEAMAAGCIPIAYDIRYGPADLIRHGRNGLLVPSGDLEALAAAIGSLQRMPPRKVAAMRRAAVRSARAFDERRVVATWARELSWARARRDLRRSHRVPRLRAALHRVPFGPRLRRMAVRAQAAVGRFARSAPRSRRPR
ncbi:glycosyltransferase [Agromyces sp. NPDC057679]|uniref:glycosyltransferase n=1 Tax=Agromyces sp. NPDC057679 TaxID=3346207 RepID=UPI00366E3437